MIKVKATKLFDADKERGCVKITKEYLSPDGLACREWREVHRESDYVNGKSYRISCDNGKTFGEWITVKKDGAEFYGDDEMISEDTKMLWNPVCRHYVYTHWSRYFLGGHELSYQKFWKSGKRTFFDHQYIAIKKEWSTAPESCKLVKYEAGEDFSRENPRNPEFLYKNLGFLNAPTVLSSGDIAVPVGIPVENACKMSGIDVNEVFPSCPSLHRAVIVARGKFNPKSREYDFSFSNPVILGDLESSRGIDEPIVTELKSGRLLLVMRGSNVRNEVWNTRIPEGTPSYKWYSYSDDGGKTFTEPTPWKFDCGKPIYSAATISEFIRSTKNGKLYWIGNISDEKAYGNFPRFPLYIAEVDDEVGVLKSETLTVIDTRREGETEKVQLSNFALHEDRENLDFVICLEKLGQFDESVPFYGETWKYTVTV